MFLIAGACKMFCGKVGIPEFLNVGRFFLISILFFSDSGFISCFIFVIIYLPPISDITA